MCFACISDVCEELDGITVEPKPIYCFDCYYSQQKDNNGEDGNTACINPLVTDTTILIACNTTCYVSKIDGKTMAGKLSYRTGRVNAVVSANVICEKL